MRIDTIDRIHIRQIDLDLLKPFETSFGTTTKRNIILAAVTSGDRVGWGECTAGEEPNFNEEFTDGAWEVLRTFIVPGALGRDVGDPSAVGRSFAWLRGNRMAFAAVETAIWDLRAKLVGEPLWRLLGGTRPEIACGVSIGLQPTIDDLITLVDRELAAGYRRIKIKIAPARDVELVRAVRARFGDIVLSVDANSAYTLDDVRILEALDDFGLLMIEQPLWAGDLIDHARLQERLRTPICLDESIVDVNTVRQALDIGACRIVNIKLGRVGGHAAARRIAGMCLEAKVPVWCGGMLESGIGRLHNAAMSSHAAFTLPGDVSDSRRYWSRDVVHPRPSVGTDGMMRLSAEPGLGAEVDVDFLDTITTRQRVFE